KRLSSRVRSNGISRWTNSCLACTPVSVLPAPIVSMVPPSILPSASFSFCCTETAYLGPASRDKPSRHMQFPEKNVVKYLPHDKVTSFLYFFSLKKSNKKTD